MRETDPLFAALRDLAQAVPQFPPEEVEQRLLAALRARRTERRRRFWRYAIEAAASVLIAGALYFSSTNRPFIHSYPALTPGTHSSNASGPGSEPAAYGIPGFIPLPYAQNDVPIGDAMVVRVRARASRFGLASPSAQSKISGAQVAADLLIGQDGVPRAVRFIP